MANPKNAQPEFLNFLSKYRVAKTEKKSNFWGMKGLTCGKFNIPDDKLNTFFTLYNKAVQNKGSFNLVEVHNEERSPILIDLDFRFENDEKIDHSLRKNNYTLLDITKIVKLYNKTISQYLNVPKSKLKAYVFEKPKPTVVTKSDTDEKTIKDGIHIIYPEFCTYYEIQFLMRMDIIKAYEENKETSPFGKINFSNPITDLIDESVIKRNGWMLYGSAKPQCVPYKLTHIFNYDGKMMPEEEMKTYMEKMAKNNYPKYFSIRKHNGDEVVEYNENINMDELKVKLDEFVNKKKTNKVTLDIQQTDEEMITETKGQKKHPLLKDVIDNGKLIKQAHLEQGTRVGKLAMVRKLIDMLSEKRAVSYPDWISVGWCLHNIDDSLLEEWIDFSKKCPSKFKKGVCEKAWAEMKHEGYRTGTLHLWAKNDSPEEYDAYMKEQLQLSLDNGLACETYEIAKIVRTKYEHQFVCASITKNDWYEFKNHRWKKDEAANSIDYILSEEISTAFAQLAIRYTNKAMLNSEDKVNYTTQIANAKLAKDVSKKLKDSLFKGRVLKDCAHVFFDPNFYTNLDENRNLLGFNNGVYDLASYQFRDGSPDDYISYSTGINFPTTEEEMIEVKKRTKELDKFLSQIMVDEDLLEYTVLKLSTFITGAIRDENFNIFTGGGGNGKSKLLELCRLSFGEYFYKISVSLLTKKRGSSSGVSPDLEKSKGRRMMVMDEPEHDDTIYVGLMKEFTGGDEITARGLFKEPVSFKPQFKMVLLCNRLPKIPSDDGGTWRRIKVLPFKSSFLPKSKKITSKYEFHQDKTLSEKLPNWKQAFMFKLIETYKHLIKDLDGELPEPNEVVSHTIAYQERSDIFMEFFNETITRTKSGSDMIRSMELYTIFKTWYANTYDRKDRPIRKDMEDYFKVRLELEYSKGYFKYIKLTDEVNQEQAEQNNKGIKFADEDLGVAKISNNAFTQKKEKVC